MPKVTVHLTADQLTQIRAELNRSGEPMSHLIRRAITAHLAGTVPMGRLEALRSARALWKGRKDLPDTGDLRSDTARES